jgi:hypothetical protein
MTHQFNINDLLEREKWSLETGIDAPFRIIIPIRRRRQED